MTLDVQPQEQLLTHLGLSTNHRASLHNGLWLLSKWRSVLIQNTLLQQQGTVVMQESLAGLDFLPQSAEGCHIANLLVTWVWRSGPTPWLVMRANTHL